LPPVTCRLPPTATAHRPPPPPAICFSFVRNRAQHVASHLVASACLLSMMPSFVHRHAASSLHIICSNWPFTTCLPWLVGIFPHCTTTSCSCSLDAPPPLDMPPPDATRHHLLSADSQRNQLMPCHCVPSASASISHCATITFPPLPPPPVHLLFVSSWLERTIKLAKVQIGCFQTGIVY
jgi:hypothetical protein